MFLVIGLGNPGVKYSLTRHNVGFMVLDRLADRYGVNFNDTHDALIAKTTIANQETILLKPLTYMNLSGKAVKKALMKSGDSQLIVIHDDLDIDFARVKIKKGGSSGGHRGIESIISEVGSSDFIRVKVGIGRASPVDEYVLSPFNKDEIEPINEAIDTATDAVVTIISEGLTKALNTFNKRTLQDAT